MEDHVQLSVLPGVSSKVYVPLSSGEQVFIPASTATDTTWFILLDGAQFVYSTLRCTVEFDYDYSVFNSTDVANTGPPNQIVSRSNDNIPSPASPSSNSGFPSSKKDTEILEKDTFAAPVPSDAHDNVTVPIHDQQLEVEEPPVSKRKPRSPHTTSLAVPVHEDRSRQALTDAPVSNADSSTTTTTEPLLQTPQIANVRNHHACEADCQNGGLMPPPRPTKKSRRSGEESQILGVHTNDQNAPPTRQPGEASQVLHTERSGQAIRSARQAGEESQTLPETSLPDSRTIEAGTSCPMDMMKVKTTTFVSGVMQRESAEPRVKRVSFNVPPEDARTMRSSSPSHASATRTPVSSKISLKGRSKIAEMTEKTGERRRHTEPPDVLTLSIPKKRPVSHAFGDVPSSPMGTQPTETNPPPVFAKDSPIPKRSRPASGKILTKRSRHSENALDSLELLARPVIVFSTSCKIQTMRKTMQSISELGGKVTKDITKADILCIPDKEGLKKTSKLVLAVVLGKIIVTESWIVQCARENNFLQVEKYQPKDKAKEKEWGVALPAALNRRRCEGADLEKLFKGYKVYLTRQLQDQLARTNNLDGFLEIATCMGASSVIRRLPLKDGLNKIVLGVAGDFDAVAVGKLGLCLYDKDLLVMSALRGRREDDKEEFKIEVPVKEESLSQS